MVAFAGYYLERPGPHLDVSAFIPGIRSLLPYRQLDKRSRGAAREYARLPVHAASPTVS